MSKDKFNLIGIVFILIFIIYTQWFNVNKQGKDLEEVCEKVNEVAFDATNRDLIDCEKYNE